MEKKNVENIVLVVLVFLLLIKQVIFTLTDINIFDKLSKIVFIKGRYIAFVIILVIVILGIWGRYKAKDVILNNKCEFPVTSLDGKIPVNSNVQMTFKVEPFQKVVYWVFDSELSSEDVLDASNIKKYSNAGIAKADENGTVKLWFRRPELSSGEKIEDKDLFLFIRREESPGILGPITKLNYKE